MTAQPTTIAQSQLQSQARLTLNSRAQVSDISSKSSRSFESVKGAGHHAANAQTFSDVLRSTTASGAQWQPKAAGQNGLSATNLTAG
jgi:hypothetical protein